MTEFVTDPTPTEPEVVEPDVVEAFEEVAEVDENELMAALVAERTEDLKRLQAEYVNYKKRVDRDRAVAREKGIESVMIEMLPVMDAMTAAQVHDDSEGLKLIIAELTRVASKFGLVGYGESGDVFDPHRHEALMQVPTPGADEMTIADVIQRGYALKEAIIRPARVSVAVPVDDAAE